MITSDNPVSSDTKLQRITWLSMRDKERKWCNLIHLFNEESLEVCFNELDGRKAVGEDGITKEMYRENLKENLSDLISRMKSLSYRPGNIKQVEIPKEGKGVRALGISNIEDKLMQKMMKKILESIYEPLFLDCSYGFRPGRGCHDAIKDLHNCLYAQNVECVIDVDLKDFFGSVDHELLMNMIEGKIEDRKLTRYLRRILKTGILIEGELKVCDEGVTQGSIVSPILSNIFANEVLDQWFEDVVKRHIEGKLLVFRYADDLVIACEFEKDAKKVKEALIERLNKYKLQLNEEKTKMVPFSKKNYEKGINQGHFDFLGFTFYLGKSRKGATIPKLKTSGKRLRAKLKNVNVWAKKICARHKLPDIWSVFRRKLQGHTSYYGVSFNVLSVSRFFHQATRILFKNLNRRSQKKSFDWGRYNCFIKRNPLPKVKIYHALW